MTNFGINSASHPGVDVAHLTRDQAKGIYQQEYWQPLGLDAANPAVQRVRFDTAVMEGVAQARKLIRELKAHLTAGQAETVRTVTRNLPAIVRRSGGYSSG